MGRTFIPYPVVLLLSPSLVTAGCMQNEPDVTTAGSNDTARQGRSTGSAGLQAAPADYPETTGTWRSDAGSVYFLNDTIREMSAGENMGGLLAE